ncbi:MAG: hypothetical protein CVU23_07790 [Betaproteobacteria bacterium HGW-Betaproteobacteria-17]|jgi:PAS domain-containing protein|nr:MAG: hypothetical protein CVU56_18690 [Deltaproteobacteria bacterium HGW-Deltaproteobacteria-14]PKO65650.1 MAG: hypothetical protein CVU23_07790 [Betaproteobacteria bacterium HGW-Betaproteobacteria-17]
MSDAPTWHGPVGFRVRLTLALVGVLALVVPQVVLTVDAMIHLHDGGSEVARLGALGGRAEELAARVDTLLAAARGMAPGALADAVDRASHEIRAGLAESPLPDSADTIADALTAWRDVVSPIAGTLEADPTPDIHPWVAALGHARERNLAAIAAWHANHALPDERAAGTHIAWLEDRLAGEPERLQLAALPYELADRGMAGAFTATRGNVVTRAAAAVRRALGALRSSIHETMSAQAQTIKREVDAANRYLVTLVLLTLVYVAALILLLPGRLVGPLRHLRAVMDRAAAGHVDAEARTLGEDEMGQLGRALNGLLRRTRSFDALKRDRIVQDRGHIRQLLEMVPSAFAILDPRHRIEHANRAFRELFRLPEDFEDRSLLDLVEGADLEPFAELLDDALSRRRAIDHLPLTLDGGDGPRVYLLTLDPARNRAGRVAALRIRLDEAPTAGAPSSS